MYSEPVPRHRLLVLAAIAALCWLASALTVAHQAAEPTSRYLFTWVGDEDRADSDFLAVVDLSRQGDRYGTIVATTPSTNRFRRPSAGCGC